MVGVGCLGDDVGVMRIGVVGGVYRHKERGDKYAVKGFLIINVGEGCDGIIL